MSDLLLDRFREVFDGKKYRHRRSTIGDKVAQFLYEDLYVIDQSKKYNGRVDAGDAVLNSKNTTRGVKHRRGDGSFGRIIPDEEPVWDEGFYVARGPTATIQIGAEVKILAKAMMKQIDRVQNDLRNQARQFRRSNDEAITVGIVGVNHAEECRSYEGDRHYDTGETGAHPVDEAEQAIERLENVRPDFDELIVLRFDATNKGNFPFEWVDRVETRRDYTSAVVRIASRYQRRF